jgi:hypothetical protein
MDRNLVYVDTDISLGTPGAEIDDGAAIIFLLRQKSLEVAASGSVFGNVCLQDATMNLSRLLTWLDYDRIPLGIGAEKPLVADMNWFEDWRSGYGTTLPWHRPSSTLLAANAIIQTIHTNPGKVSILSLGPMHRSLSVPVGMCIFWDWTLPAASIFQDRTFLHYRMVIPPWSCFARRRLAGLTEWRQWVGRRMDVRCTTQWRQPILWMIAFSAPKI